MWTRPAAPLVVVAVLCLSASAGSQIQAGAAAKATALPVATFGVTTTSDAARQAFDAAYDAYLDLDWVGALREFHKAAAADTALRLARAFELFLTQRYAPLKLADSIERLQAHTANPNLIEGLMFTDLRERVLGQPGSAALANVVARAAPDDNRLLADWVTRNGIGSAAAVSGSRILRNRQPDSYRAQALVAMNVAAPGDSAEALTAMAEALRLGGDRALSHYAAGWTMIHRRRYDDAVMHFGHALQRDSTYYAAAYYRGNVLLWLRRPAEARADFQLVARTATYPTHRAAAMRAVALSYLHEGNLDRAIQEMEQAAKTLRADGNAPDAVAAAHRHLAYLSAAKKDLPAVQRHLAAAISGHPNGNNGLEYHWAAMSWSLAGQPVRARAALAHFDRIVAQGDFVSAPNAWHSAHAMVLAAEHHDTESLAQADSATGNHFDAVSRYLVYTHQGRSADAANQMTELMPQIGYAIDALAYPVARYMWAKNAK